MSSGNEDYNIAQGENKPPVSFMMDTNCEELAFPVLFPNLGTLLSVMWNCHQ